MEGHAGPFLKSYHCFVAFEHGESPFRPILSTFPKFTKATINSVMSLCLSTWNNSAPNGRIFMKFGI